MAIDGSQGFRKGGPQSSNPQTPAAPNKTPSKAKPKAMPQGIAGQTLSFFSRLLSGQKALFPRAPVQTPGLALPWLKLTEGRKGVASHPESTTPHLKEKTQGLKEDPLNSPDQTREASPEARPDFLPAAARQNDTLPATGHTPEFIKTRDSLHLGKTCKGSGDADDEASSPFWQGLRRGGMPAFFAMVYYDRQKNRPANLWASFLINAFIVLAILLVIYLT